MKALEVACPRMGCEAKPGQPCRNVSGRFVMPANEVHPSRESLAAGNPCSAIDATAGINYNDSTGRTT